MVDRTPKRVAKKAEPEYNDFFEAMESGESEKTAPAAGPDISGQLEALMKRVDALSVQQNEYRAPQPQPQVQYVQAPQPRQTEEVIPDPVLDSAGYTSWLMQRAEALTQSKLEAYKQEQADQAGSSEAYDNLWTGFLAQDGNSEWEKEPEKVQVAAMKVSKKLSAKGIDPTAYMFQNTDKFFADVSKTLVADFGKRSSNDDDVVDEDETDRTGGLPGGQASPVPASKAEGKGLPDMIGDLTSIQRKGGWY